MKLDNDDYNALSVIFVIFVLPFMILYGASLNQTHHTSYIHNNPHITYQKSSNVIPKDDNLNTLSNTSFSSPSLNHILISDFKMGAVDNNNNPYSAHRNDIEIFHGFSKKQSKPNNNAVFSIGHHDNLLVKPCLRTNLNFKPVFNFLKDGTTTNYLRGVKQTQSHYYKNFITINLRNNIMTVHDSHMYITFKVHSIAHSKDNSSIKYTLYSIKTSSSFPNDTPKLITIETRPNIY